jgi:hypothetical protein
MAYYDDNVQVVITHAKNRYIFWILLHGPIFPDLPEKQTLASECFLFECKDATLFRASSFFTSVCH